MFVGEPGNRTSGIVIVQFVPAGTHIRRQLPDPVQRRPVRGPLRVTAGHMDDVQFSLDPGRDPGRAPHQRPAGRPAGDGHHDPLTGLPHCLGLVPPEMLAQFLLGLIREEAQRQLPQGDQVACLEEVTESLRDPLFRVDVPVQHPAAQLLW